jgi:hypothetical protein
MRTAIVINQLKKINLERSGAVMRESSRIHLLLASQACTLNSKKLSKKIRKEE